ncbi:hypothetical protein TNCV_2655051 [Trichonephila clavipes]|nr:hypothetical protein TNCV_2655051 [Trichonephila clavipes]
MGILFSLNLWKQSRYPSGLPLAKSPIVFCPSVCRLGLSINTLPNKNTYHAKVEINKLKRRKKKRILTPPVIFGPQVSDRDPRS